MRAIPGVRSVAANAMTGSLLVHHDDAAETRANILASLAAFGPTAAIAARVPGTSDKFADVLLNAIAERIIEHALRAAVAAVI